MSLNGNLVTLWQRAFSSSTRVNLVDIFYDKNNDLMIAAISDDSKYRILWIKDFGDSSGITILAEIISNRGQPLSLVA